MRFMFTKIVKFNRKCDSDIFSEIWARNAQIRKLCTLISNEQDGFNDDFNQGKLTSNHDTYSILINFMIMI